MTRTFIQTREFSRRWDEMGFNDDDLRKLESDIMSDPSRFPFIRGTGGLQKARVSINKGKSSGARVCFVDFALAESIYLITVFGKKEKANLSKEECNQIRKAIETLKKSLGSTNNE
ncbi:RelE toxin of RelE / RelB toxin-antitoxin system [Lachnospiraceae bacterium XBB2008]|nr:RelE toxin of RelE / RelB toxin-antitoxin system [Lachnospiraceae bacterium XBB2008]